MSDPGRPSLRSAQLSETRKRILDGLVATMAGGFAEVSIPAVARAAGVSVPTVYRHFKTKKILVAALAEHVASGSQIDETSLKLKDLEGLDALCASVPVLFGRLASMDATMRAAMASELGNKVRRASFVPLRQKAFARILWSETKGLSPGDRKLLHNVVLILWSSAALRAFKDYLNLSTEEAAAHVSWAIRVLVRGAKRAK